MSNYQGTTKDRYELGAIRHKGFGTGKPTDCEEEFDWPKDWPYYTYHVNENNKELIQEGPFYG